MIDHVCNCLCCFVVFRTPGEETDSGDCSSDHYKLSVFAPDRENPHARKVRKNHITEDDS